MGRNKGKSEGVQWSNGCNSYLCTLQYRGPNRDLEGPHSACATLSNILNPKTGTLIFLPVLLCKACDPQWVLLLCVGLDSSTSGSLWVIGESTPIFENRDPCVLITSQMSAWRQTESYTLLKVFLCLLSVTIIYSTAASEAYIYIFII